MPTSVPATEHQSDAEGDPDVERQSDSETASAHNSGDPNVKHPVPGDRKQAQECPEPAATDRSPGWREFIANDPYAFAPKTAPRSADEASGTARSGKDDAELRNWFWDSGEPPPF